MISFLPIDKPPPSHIFLHARIFVVATFFWQTLSEIKKQNEDAQLKAFEVDLSSFQSVLKFKDSLEQWLLESDLHSSIQILVNNAGIMATSSRPTIEGFDR